MTSAQLSHRNGEHNTSCKFSYGPPSTRDLSSDACNAVTHANADQSLKTVWAEYRQGMCVGRRCRGWRIQQFLFSFFSRLNFDNLCRPDLTKSSAPRTNLNITTALSAESVYFVNNRLSQSQHNILLADENVINHVWKLFCRSRRIAQ